MLEKEEESKFEDITIYCGKQFGFTKDAQVIRYLIAQKHIEIKEMNKKTIREAQKEAASLQYMETLRLSTLRKEEKEKRMQAIRDENSRIAEEIDNKW